MSKTLTPIAKLKKRNRMLSNTLQAIRNDSQAWLDGDMDSLSQSELLQVFVNAANEALSRKRTHG